ncbi:zinc finger protein 774-like [Protopterus annectens]|uniref:zinc finger protein 774-like n=1 Tax=Protopterus annectens TaxID=7888 RepID=UPI001CFA6D8C|nr:zinc finger protein 774-like [Protopterus annectens]XP_043936780.1 zinc finger protein 774-like [Protopterus annectens]XP_043936789.1 zinc finger protein 774-like [Protopterus annectens]
MTQLPKGIGMACGRQLYSLLENKYNKIHRSQSQEQDDSTILKDYLSNRQPSLGKANAFSSRCSTDMPLMQGLTFQKDQLQAWKTIPGMSQSNVSRTIKDEFQSKAESVLNGSCTSFLNQRFIPKANVQALKNHAVDSVSSKSELAMHLKSSGVAAVLKPTDWHGEPKRLPSSILGTRISEGKPLVLPSPQKRASYWLARALKGQDCDSSPTISMSLMKTYTNRSHFLKEETIETSNTEPIDLSKKVDHTKLIGPLSPNQKTEEKDVIMRKTIHNRHSETASEELCSSNTDASKDSGPAAHSTQESESGEGVQFGKYLLIDSRGMPYTVFMEESKPKKKLLDPLPSPVYTVLKSALPKNDYTCPVCLRKFSYLSYLQRHSITHSEQKPHVCKECGKSFKRTSHLERHKYTHSGEKPYQCEICQKSFRDAGELLHHQRVHTGERPHQCDVCHMRFSEKHALQRHIRRKHLKQLSLQ